MRGNRGRAVPGAPAAADPFPIPVLPEGADPVALTHFLPRQEGAGARPQAAHASSSWRLRSASAGRLRSLVKVRLRGRWGPSPPPRPLPRGLRAGGTMFTSTGSSGLYKAPLSKSLLLVPGALSLLLALLLPHCQRFFLYDLRAVKNDLQVWRLICGRIICLDLKDTFCSSLLIYNFRIFERRYGSRKFASFLLGSWVLSALFDFILVEVVQHSFDVTVASNLPSGLTGRWVGRMRYYWSPFQFRGKSQTRIYSIRKPENNAGNWLAVSPGAEGLMASAFAHLAVWAASWGHRPCCPRVP
ncbi:uncharacterized protein LOC129678712 [Psammomys obesus]|uniref:uncharacterized protein LOC129678712 n=1 Tax=Psammomys obesus TaxID=48139 RepID=UPI002452BC8C|nr:uncharacterized protein LOC129678712 [Psammomys obesus]